MQQAWRLANEQANRRLVAFVEDDSKVLRSTNGTVTLDLRQILQQVGGDSGLVNRVQDRLPPDAGRIVLLRSDQLSAAQKGVRALRVVAYFVVLVVLLIFAAAIWIAPDRRRALRACAIGVLAAGLVLVFARRVLGDQLIDQVVSDSSIRPAAHEVWWIATDQLKLATQSILFVGLIGLLGAWIAGPGTRATATRHALAPYLRDPWLAYGALAAIVLLLLAWSPTPATRTWLTVILRTAAAAHLKGSFCAARPRASSRMPSAGTSPGGRSRSAGSPPRRRPPRKRASSVSDASQNCTRAASSTMPSSHARRNACSAARHREPPDAQPRERSRPVSFWDAFFCPSSSSH